MAIMTADQIAALTDSAYVAKVATGPVIEREAIADALSAGVRVYGVVRSEGIIMRIMDAAWDLDRYTGFYVGASALPVGRA